VGLDRGPLSLVRITVELPEWKSSGSGSRKSRLTAVGILCADHAIPYTHKKLALTSPTSGGRSVDIVHLRTKATEFRNYCIYNEMSGAHIGTVGGNECNSFCLKFEAISKGESER
jgi:hypothetical protein